MTVGVISAQKKILRLLTAWEENMPMMEKAIEKFLFSVSERSAQGEDKHTLAIIPKFVTQRQQLYTVLKPLMRL